MEILLRRIYEPASAADDGLRVFVERLWPRGVSKQKAALDLWPKELSPSPELRRWYGHDESKWEEFEARYRAEIDANDDEVESLLGRLAGHPRVTFLYASREETRNSAQILRAAILERCAAAD